MNRYILGLLVVLLCSCNSKDGHKPSKPIYFNLSAYFKAEVNRLQKIKPTVEKEVLVAGKAERKVLKINNWATELAAFSESDINKAAWRGEFTQTISGNKVTYTRKNDEIPIKELSISKNGTKIIAVFIAKQRQNYLYASTDTLIYYPDSLYSIQNQQKIKLLSPKLYRATAKFVR